LHRRVGHVGDAQAAADILQQHDLPVQLLAAAVGLQLHSGVQAPAEQAQAQHQ
jgi:hypothetical protein